ncbi:hypothetical protein MSTE_04963 [Mycobacteroides stephanolepidis]|uniref:Reductase n=1 Tax=[Mycobacterium] stephanolepidis TaxID=1520670 RepID=A0A1Z4F4Y4_9MYCO|nr:reductase [[Mycobacterium] stephanolepidis]BAY00255.1 hypothetical protein MSTE_04963 [[Mycobacterium] stephanolepidis]
MAIALDNILATIKDKQWALADIDWDAPGADQITDEQRPALKEFMSDLVWIENVGAQGFVALAKKAPNEVLKQIYTYFHAEEQRHANAELALMRRWGMIEEGEVPLPNKNIRLVIEWLDRYSDDLNMATLGTAIPALETALDGALVKFLLDEVADPLCHEVFQHINSDESRHLAVGFGVLDMLGASPMRKLIIETVGTVMKPSVMLAALIYSPLLTRMMTNISAMGLSEEKLYNAVRRYENVGGRSANTRRIPAFHIIKHHMGMSINHVQPYQFISESLGKAIDLFPIRVLGKTPTWSEELTYKPVSR